jgi:glucose-1-phosphate adenylyltransferase
MLNFHKQSNADLTIAVIEVPYSDAHQFGIMNTDSDCRITEFEEKPKQPKSNLASMGIYIFSWKKLRMYLMGDEQDEDSEHDFGKNVIPAYLNDKQNVFAYRFGGYWKDVGTIDALWQANMDMIDNISLGKPDWQIMSRTVGNPPQFVAGSGRVVHSLVTEGCEIYGSVYDSVISGGVTVEEGAELHGCIVMANCTIKQGAKLNRAILTEGSVIKEDEHIGSDDGKIAVI